jgi:hypothetical protein
MKEGGADDLASSFCNLTIHTRGGESRHLIHVAGLLPIPSKKWSRGVLVRRLAPFAASHGFAGPHEVLDKVVQ